MASHSAFPASFDPFDPSNDTWESFLDRFECYLKAQDLNELPEARRTACFLNACGKPMFRMARALVAPQVVHEVPWDELMDKLKKHYAPTPSFISCHFHFRRRIQAEGESITQYVAALRDAARDCDFEILERSLLEQLVCGVRDLQLQLRLLAHSKLTLAIAIDDACAAETSFHSSANIQCCILETVKSPPQLSIHATTCSSTDNTNHSETVARLRTTTNRRHTPTHGTNQRATPTPQPSYPPCPSCGDQHPRSSCQFRTATCYSCGRAGHLARVCRSTPNQPANRAAPPRNTHQRLPERRGDCFATKPDRELFDGEEEVFLAAGGGTKKISLVVTIEGSPLEMEVDTGSARSLVSWDTFSHLVADPSQAKLGPMSVKLRDYQGNLISTKGEGNFYVKKGAYSGILPLIIVAKPLPSLLGRDWFTKLGLSVSGIHSVTPDVYSCIFDEFSDVFSNTLGCYVGTPISLNLDPKVAPIRLKPRRVPFALRKKVDAELDKLIQQGVLEATDYSKWETPLVIPVKPNGSLRLCGDYKVTLNHALSSNPYPVPVVQHPSARGQFLPSWIWRKRTNNSQWTMPLRRLKLWSPTGAHSVVAVSSLV
ncbi:uncharacterized protein [Erythrolamprus reginae]|uniref:uncharacterized protein n=1 Tax=Erythrolamprus reginae TaxID=121349 RepID=UPI00396C4C99